MTSSYKRAKATGAAVRSSRAKKRPRKNGTGTGEGLKTIGGQGGCWCGQESGHDWPGKSDGKPHPR